MHTDFGPPPIFFFIFGVILFIIVGRVLLSLGSGISEWSSNNAQPERDDPARIVSKRTEVSGGEKSTSTTYFTTFELSAGERKEFEISGRDYGLLAEGDEGQLRHQGTRFLGFAHQLETADEPPRMAESEMPANLVCEYCGSAIAKGKIKCDSCGWTWKPNAKIENNA